MMFKSLDPPQEGSSRFPIFIKLKQLISSKSISTEEDDSAGWGRKRVWLWRHTMHNRWSEVDFKDRVEESEMYQQTA